jgi:hypothetical protein
VRKHDAASSTALGQASHVSENRALQLPNSRGIEYMMGGPQEVGNRSAGIVRIAKVRSHQFPLPSLDLAQNSTHAWTKSQPSVLNRFLN